jgi:putative redox protein
MTDPGGAGAGSLAGSREKEPPPSPEELPEHVVVHWDGEHRFHGGREGRPSITVDGKKVAGPGAVDTLVISLVACSSMDVVDILDKRKTPAESLAVDVRYARVDGTPRRLDAVHLVFRVRTASEAHHVERAVELSVRKYCSVATSLRDEVCITTEVRVEKP